MWGVSIFEWVGGVSIGIFLKDGFLCIFMKTVLKLNEIIKVSDEDSKRLDGAWKGGLPQFVGLALFRGENVPRSTREEARAIASQPGYRPVRLYPNLIEALYLNR